MGKSPQETQILIEKIAVNNYQWANEQGNSRRQTCMIEMDTLNMLSAPMNNVVKLLSGQVVVGPRSLSNAHVACCSTCGDNHDTNECVDFE